MDKKELMINSANNMMIKNKKFEDIYGSNLDFVFNFEKGIYMAKRKESNSPEFGGDFICIARYQLKHKKFLWEHSNPYSSQNSRNRANIIKEIYKEYKELDFLGGVGLDNIELKMAQCIAACVSDLCGGVYLANITQKDISSFMVLKTAQDIK